MKKRDKRKILEKIGWGLFACGSFVYLIDSILNHNIMGIIGSAAFVIACVVFMIAEKY